MQGMTRRGGRVGRGGRREEARREKERERKVQKEMGKTIGGIIPRVGGDLGFPFTRTDVVVSHFP